MGYALDSVIRSSFYPVGCASMLALMAACARPAVPPKATPTEPGSVLIRGARVFTGDEIWDGADVLIQDGLIRGLGQRLPAGEGTTVIEAAGNTLLPGLIDSHTHAYLDEHLEQALAFGVTTEIDMFSVNAEWIAEERAASPDHHADVYTAGVLATVPGGHGTQYGAKISTVSDPSQADAFVAARIEEGAHFIKIVYDDLHTFGRSYPTMDYDTLKALIDAAHRAKKMAVVHVLTAQQAHEAIRAGADGLAHIFHDSAPSAELIDLAAERGIFVTDTLPLIHSLCDSARSSTLRDTPGVSEFLTPQGRQNLSESFSGRLSTPPSCKTAHTAVAALHAAGVAILASTDAPNPGTAHGASLHDELALLVEAGLSPEVALRAATSAPADVFQLGDRGRIGLGLRADLVLVRGNPFDSIQATRDILRVWKAGVPFDRDAYSQRIKNATQGSSANAGADP